MERTDHTFLLSGLERFTDEEFYQFCSQNSNIRIERNADGTILIMSPETPSSGRINSYINYCLYGWNLTFDLGTVFGTDTGFTLPDTSVRSPDACWVSNAKMNGLSSKDLQRFTRICPEFVVEVLSPTDSLKATELKMEQWLANGTLLAWLINPKAKTVKIYRKDRLPQQVSGFDGELSGEDVLPGFSLDLRKIPR